MPQYVSFGCVNIHTLMAAGSGGAGSVKAFSLGRCCSLPNSNGTSQPKILCRALAHLNAFSESVSRAAMYNAVYLFFNPVRVDATNACFSLKDWV